MQRHSEEIRMSGRTIAFVPTMGFLHDGHLELIRVGKRYADHVVVSIFVNPIQFGPNEDFERYPRDMEGDLDKAEKAGADLVFTPNTTEMYPPGFQTTVRVARVTEHLCGLSRPGHFDGVTTVVAKLFHIVKPHTAIFGEKDYQQLTVIRRMVKDLEMDIRILGVPTVREPDGLAMSSRNAYLRPEERENALSLKRSLELARDMIGKGERDSSRIVAAAEGLIRGLPHTEIDYVRICDPETLEDLPSITGEALLALAVRVGKTRLIDNCILKIE
jgi:pantoate--beta-alanine ligase